MQKNKSLILKFFTLLIIFISGTVYTTVLLSKNENQTEFITYIQKGKKAYLKTAIIQYVRKNTTVDLISAIHIADALYYKKLNKLFTTYDSVLYELIKHDTSMPDLKKPNNESSIYLIQSLLKSLLDLEHQLHIVNYKKKNFIHADLLFKDFNNLQVKKKTSLYSMILKASKKYETQLAKKGKTPQQLGLLHVMYFLISDNSSRAIKRWLAPQLKDMIKTLSGAEEGIAPVILTARNKRAIEVLSKVIKQKKKKIAIFYGAAHMPDLEKRLLKMGFKKRTSRWITAWDLSIK